MERLSKMRPLPNYYVIYGSKATITEAFRYKWV